MTPPLAYNLQLKAPPMPDFLFDPLAERSKMVGAMRTVHAGVPARAAGPRRTDARRTRYDADRHWPIFEGLCRRVARSCREVNRAGSSNEAGEQPGTAGGIKF